MTYIISFLLRHIMANLKISQLPVATTPLSGTETAIVIQGGVTKQAAKALI